MVLETTHGHTITGHAVHAEGKRTGVVVPGGNGRIRGEIERIRTVGREEPTLAERARDEFILRLLRGELPSLVQSPFVRALWFPEGSLGGERRGGAGTGREGSDEGEQDNDAEYEGSMSFAGLNAAQKEVVRAMWADDEPLVVVHGASPALFFYVASASADWSVRRSSWDGKNADDLGRARGVGTVRRAGVGHRAVQRRCEEHRADADQARRRLQAHRVEGVLRRVVSVCARFTWR